MQKARVGFLWVCNLQNYFILLLFLFTSHILVLECQIIRKSVELPVKNYLSSPRTSRDSWNGRDPLYTPKDDFESVRNFDHLPPHSPTSALVFPGLINELVNLRSTNPTPLFLTPTIVYNGRSGRTSLPHTIATKSTSDLNDQKNLPFKINLLLPTSASPTTVLESGLRQTEKEFSLTPTTPLVNSNGELFTPRQQASTPVPTLSDSNDPIFGYFNKLGLPISSANSREDRIDQMVEGINGLAQHSNTIPHSGVMKNKHGKYVHARQVPLPNSLNTPYSYVKQKGSSSYYDHSAKSRYKTHSKKEPSFPYIKEKTIHREIYKQSGESSDYDSNSGNYEADYTSYEQQNHKYYSGQPDESRELPDESNDYENSFENPTYNEGHISSSEYYKHPNDFQDYRTQSYSQETPSDPAVDRPHSLENKHPHHTETDDSLKHSKGFKNKLPLNSPKTVSDGSKKERKVLPSVPPTIGVIGWKSNKDLETKWKPNKALLNIPNQYIKEDTNDNAYNNGITTTYSPPHKQREKQPTYQSQSFEQEKGENEEEGDGGDEDSEEEEEGDEEEEEEESGEEGESEIQEYEDERNDSQEQSSRYELSAENFERSQYSQQYRDDTSTSLGSHDEYEDPLPPGPPYLPPSNLKGDPKTNGYLPFPSSGVKPPKNFDHGTQEPWKPILPSSTVKSKNLDSLSANEQYKTEIDRWLLGEGSILDFPKENIFHGWSGPVKNQSNINLETVEHSEKNLSLKRKPNRNKNSNDRPKKPTESDRIESKDLPVEHRLNHFSEEFTLKERKTSRAPKKGNPSGTNYSALSPDQEEFEKGGRNSDREFEVARVVPTRDGRPKTILRDKPSPISGFYQGFAPKRVLKQISKQSTAEHKPKRAGLVTSSYQEKDTTPSPRELVEDKKVQQTIEEDGYEDSAYDHGLSKNQEQYGSHSSNEGFSPEIIWGMKSLPVNPPNTNNRNPAPLSNKAVRPSYNFKYTGGRNIFSTNIHPSFSRSVEYDDRSFVGSGYDIETPSKERKSRDLSSQEQDRTNGERSFNINSKHSHASLREVEHQTFIPVSQNSFKGDSVQSERKYKQIIRNTTSSQEEREENRKDRGLQVKVKEDELNIRHPFLPKDGSGDVQIDYVESRKQYEADSSYSRRKHRYEYDDEVETEKPKTTTPKVTTTTESTTTTTTEYTPEDPAKFLTRLKSNVFLSSIFPTENIVDAMVDQYAKSPTSTTPEITTYRGKATSTTAETTSVETPKQNLQRLKLNPFLSSILTRDDQMPEETPRQPKRKVRVKHIVVAPRNPDSLADSSVKHVEQLTLAQYSGPSHGLMYTQVPRRSQQRIASLAKHLNDEGVEKTHVVARRSVGSESEEKDAVRKPIKKTTTEKPADVKQYPFYYTQSSVSFPKLSPLAYALSPTALLNKSVNGMELYESTEKKVPCEEITATEIDSTSKNTKSFGENLYNEKQSTRTPGDKSGCLKVKFFGESPSNEQPVKKFKIPEFKLPSQTESLDLYYDVLKSIKSNPESPQNNSDLYKEKDFSHILKKGYQGKENNKTSDKIKLTKYIYSSTYRNASQINSTVAAESKLNLNLTTLNNQTDLRKQQTNYNNQEWSNDIKVKEPTQIPQYEYFTDFIPIQEVQAGFVPIIPVVLHPPKDVSVSFKSKGTSNHPKIKTAKATPAPYNRNIKIVPKGTVGYLQAHSPFHIHDVTSTILSGEIKDSVKPVFIPDSRSSAARMLTEVIKQPTTVAYLAITPEGNLLHKHIRTYVPVPSRNQTTTKSYTQHVYGTDEQRSWQTIPHDTKNWYQPRYRLKRSNENDKYINSKESQELKNYLIQKYLQSKEMTESSSEKSSSEKPLARTQITTSRTIRTRHKHPPFSSRYTTSRPAVETFSTEGNEEIDLKPTQRSPSQPTRAVGKPNLRFPKLQIRSQGVRGVSKPALQSPSETVPVKTVTTSTTTTPPSTTTRRYKPRMVYQKEFGKPLDKVTNIFAVLKRPPILSTILPELESTTEKRVDIINNRTTSRNNKPISRRFDQSGERRVSTAISYKKPFSSLFEQQPSTFESPNFRHPTSRSSRNTAESRYSEMLVYMVNPTTGLGDWVVMTAPSTSISRIDHYGVVNRFQNQNNKQSNAKRRKIRPGPDFERFNSKYVSNDDGERELRTTEAFGNYEYTIFPNPTQMTKIQQTTNAPVTVKPRRKQTESPLLDPAPFAPKKDDPLSTAYSTVNPKVIWEPYKRKYYYAKM